MRVILFSLCSLIGLLGFSQNKYLGISIQDINISDNNEKNWIHSISDSIHWQQSTHLDRINFGLIYGINQVELRLGFHYAKNARKTINNWLINNQKNTNEVHKTQYDVSITASKLNRIKIFKNFSLKYGPSLQLKYQFKYTNKQRIENFKSLYSSHYINNIEIKTPNYFTYSIGLQTAIIYDLKPFTLVLEAFNFLTYFSRQTESHITLHNKDTNITTTTYPKTTSENISFNKNNFSITLLLNF